MAVASIAIFITVLWVGPSLARAVETGPGDVATSNRLPHEVLVGFRSGSTSETRQQILKSAGADQVDGIYGLPKARRVKLDNGQSIDEAIAELDQEEIVAWVQPNLIGHISEIPNDPEFGQLWAFRNTGQSINGTSGTADADTDVDQAWELSTGGGSRIAVVDTGVDATNPDLSGVVDQELSRNFAASIETGDVDSGDWEDQNGHGTHVAGTIAAEGDNGIGVAGTSWDTDLVAVRACDFDGYCDSASVASALAYAGSIGSAAVNVSLGFSGSESDASAIRSAISQYPDTVYIVAAGLTNGDPYIHLNVNGSTSAATLTTQPLNFSGGRSCSSVYYLTARLRNGQTFSMQYSVDGGSTWETPGPYGSITSQSGLDDEDFYEMSAWFGEADGESDVLVRYRYSSTGASSQAPTVDVAYPLVSCVGEQATEGSYDVYSGTSMATPQVTGAAALISGYEPDLDASGLRTALLSSVDQVGSLSGKVVTGGRLNVAAAMSMATEEAEDDDDPENTENGSSTSSATMKIVSVRRMANGRARVTVRVSSPGRIWIKGTRAVSGQSRKVSRAGTVLMPVVARGSAARRLRRHLRSQVFVTVGYRPTGGTNRYRKRWVTLNRDR